MQSKSANLIIYNFVIYDIFVCLKVFYEYIVCGQDNMNTRQWYYLVNPSVCDFQNQVLTWRFQYNRNCRSTEHAKFIPI